MSPTLKSRWNCWGCAPPGHVGSTQSSIRWNASVARPSGFLRCAATAWWAEGGEVAVRAVLNWPADKAGVELRELHGVGAVNDDEVQFRSDVHASTLRGIADDLRPERIRLVSASAQPGGGVGASFWAKWASDAAAQGLRASAPRSNRTDVSSLPPTQWADVGRRLTSPRQRVWLTFG